MTSPAPHRGPMILVLGILGLVLCPILSPLAWIMGKGDMDAMDRGELDPQGRGLSQAGMVLGIVGMALLVVWVLLAIVVLSM